MAHVHVNTVWERIRRGVFVVAEIGKNFIQTEEEQPVRVYLENAKALVRAAKDAGADAVKFQTHHVEDEQVNVPVVSPHFRGSDRYSWVTRNTHATPLDAFWRPLQTYCDQLGIVFFSTPMSRGAARKLAQLNVPLWKIGSGDVQDFVCLDYVCAYRKPIIISTGMVSFRELRHVVDFITSRHAQLAILYCISKYPCPPEEFNLGTLEELRERYPNCPIGFSDHSIGYEVDLAAVKLGARIIEKHFSFDRGLWGSDHKVSMLPREMREMVQAIRTGAWRDVDATKLYGEKARELEGAANQFRPLFNKSLVAGQDIPARATITADMVYAVRPQQHIGGMRSERYSEVIGKRARRDVRRYEPITSACLSSGKRRVCFVITSVIHYGRNRYLLEEIRRRGDLELRIVVGASALLSNYGEVLSALERDGFPCDAKILMTLEGGNAIAMAKTTGLGIMEFTTAFDTLQPDLVVVRGDRYEVLAAAIAATYLNISLAHIEGGDVSGTIDESVRHAITKLAHIHLTTNEDARRRVLRMGEDPQYTFLVGSPDLEAVARNGFVVSNAFINALGVGDVVDVTKPYLIVMQHPVTTEVGQNRVHVEETLHAVRDVGIPTIWFWPNVDAGTDEVAKAIRVFRELTQPKNIRFLKYIPPEQFIGLLKGAACLVGNSSTGIKECSYLGVPVVNVGTRQAGRLRGPNVADVDYDRSAIHGAILRQVAHGRFPQSTLYMRERTASRIAEILAEVPLYVQKRFYETPSVSRDHAEVPMASLEYVPR